MTMTPKSQFPACDVALDAGAQLVSTNGALMLLVNIVGPFYPSIILRQGDKAQKLTLQLLEESQGVMTEETHTGLQRQYDRLTMVRCGLEGGWKLKRLGPVRKYRDQAMELKEQTVTLSQLSRSDGMWKKKGKTAMQFARFRLAKKAKPGRPDQEGDNASISSEVPLLRISTMDSNITAISDVNSIDITEQASRIYATRLDPTWLDHAHHHRHDSQSDSEESDGITIELDYDTSESISEASEATGEDSDRGSTKGSSSETSTA